MTSAATMTQLPRSYVPGEHEERIRRGWEEAGAFRAGPGNGRAPYCILIPPPNVTAPLHVGHALNNTLQDILVRHHRMRGRNTLWMPGTDHAGIATQAVVEQRLHRQGTSRRELGRSRFVATVQEWKDEYEATITEQLKTLGCSCDWSRQRFTMDPICARAVRDAFFRLFAGGLIYRGKRLVNWDPVTLTALADDEVEMKEVQGHMWYLRYPLVDDERGGIESVVVATTRPETMLGDTAVAVNPADPRATELAGRRVRLPIVNRVVPIIADNYVVLPASMGGDPSTGKAEYATGFLKVTPGHDPNDWEIGIRHGLPVINVLAPDGTISADHGWPAEEFQTDQADEARPLLGLSRDEARTRVVEWFERHGLLEEVRDYTHSVGHSYRSHVPIEPYLSDQWYVRVTDDALVGEAQRALDPEQLDGPPTPPGATGGGQPRAGDGMLTFFPSRYARTYQTWHANLRDWCISRQLWWGHQIPVWGRDEDGADDATLAGRLAAWGDEARIATSGDGAEGGLPRHICVRDDADREVIERLESAGYVRDRDVLDTWFSSALWPLSTMGWPEPDDETSGLLETFNPTDVLCTAREIITLWVSRMVMFNRYFLDGRVPFRHVYIHPMIQDGHGQIMSKSLGNGVDPRDCIHSHGADAVRFTLAQMATSTQDVRLPVEMTCPHCEETFHPEEVTSGAGYRVATPEQTCPACGGEMVSGFGVVSGTIGPDDPRPVARNASVKFDHGRNFANKLWNATRFALGHLAGEGEDGNRALAVEGRPLIDRWIVARLHTTLHVVEDAIAAYQFNSYAEAMYDLVWRDFCDWYLEAIKPTVKSSPDQRQVLKTVLNAILRLLHPICPFVTEALWAHLPGEGGAGLRGVVLPPSRLLASAAWPDIDCGVHDQEAVDTFARVQALTSAVRNVRGEHRVPPRQRITLHVPAELQAVIEAGEGTVETLAGIRAVESTAGDRPPGALPLTFEGQEIWVGGLAEEVDAEAERQRLDKLIEEKETAASTYRNRLANKGYVTKAPPDVVAETRARLAETEADLAAARAALQALDAP